MFKTAVSDPKPRTLDVDELCSLASGTKVHVYEDRLGGLPAEGEIIGRAYPEADQVEKGHGSVWYLVWLTHCDPCSTGHEALVLWNELEVLR